MAPELKQLLKAALRLLDGRPTMHLETIRVADKEFRVVAERHEEQGWILVLIAEPDPVPCEFTLMTRYGLTERQMEVVRLLADRCSDREIAEALGVTLATADRHAQNVMKKLGVSSRKAIRSLLQNSARGRSGR